MIQQKELRALRAADAAVKRMEGEEAVAQYLSAKSARDKAYTGLRERLKADEDVQEGKLTVVQKWTRTVKWETVMTLFRQIPGVVRLLARDKPAQEFLAELALKPDTAPYMERRLSVEIVEA